MGRRPQPESLIAAPAEADWSPPTRLGAATFEAKSAVFRVRRSVEDLLAGPARHGRGRVEAYPALLAQSVTPLWSDERDAERGHQRGKVHNLRRAAAALNGVEVPAGQLFSFWRQVGPATPARGYASGRMLQQGCLVPAVGGGLCQLSNALYQVALEAGCEIVERHAHSRVVPGSVAEAGRDATVAWNYVDLRFRPEQTLLIEAMLTSDDLVIRFRGGVPVADARREPVSPRPFRAPGVVRSCSTCNEVACFRHDRAKGATMDARTAWLVDENWPEFQAWATSRRHAGPTMPRLCSATLFAGRPGSAPAHRWRVLLGRSGWLLAANLAPVEALARVWSLRRARLTPPERRQAELDGAAKIAKRLARLAGPEVEHMVVAQSLLPFLWREGELGGRRFDVLMTRLPMDALQARLDAAFNQHPDRRSLGDFRAQGWLAETEGAALAAATRLITPHALIADLFGARAVELAWSSTKPRARSGAVHPRRIAFPGPTVARKGAWEMREAARSLDLEVVLLGSELEGEGFWDGVRTVRSTEDWLDGVAAVVQPAVIEEQPRRLLAALAAGVPVVATKACGLRPREGLTIVPGGDAVALTAALREVVPR